MRVKIILNMIECRKCKRVLVSTHRHDFRQCACGTHCDGGREYLKRGAMDMADIRELSVVEEDGIFRMVEKG